MKATLLSILALFLAVGLLADPLSCYDIQYSPTNGPSPYNGQSVTIQALVAGVVRDKGFFLSDPEGGPWSGLYVFGSSAANNVNVGDEVLVTGTVDEFYGLTELTYPSMPQILSTGNPIPDPIELTTAEFPYQIANAPLCEKWEGVRVTISNLTVVSAPDNYHQWRAKGPDNTQSMFDTDFIRTVVPPITIGDTWYKITGFVDSHTSAGYKVRVAYLEDMQKEDALQYSNVWLTNVPNADIGQSVTLNLMTSHVNPAWDVDSYKVTIDYDPSLLGFDGVDIEGTQTPGEPTVSSHSGTISIEYAYSQTLDLPDNSLLLKLKFTPKDYCSTQVRISSFLYGDTAILNKTEGSVTVKIEKNIAYLSISTQNSSKNIFNPYMGEKIKITYGTKMGRLSRALIRIYDAQGRLVATPVHKNFSSSSGFENYWWDGRDHNLKRLEPGLYYCHAEVSDRASGIRHSAVQPIVIKSRLK